MTDRLIYGTVMFAAGMGIPVLAALNAQLGARIGSPFAAAVVLFCVALAAATVVMTATRSGAALVQVPVQPKHLLLGGMLVCFYVTSITYVAPRFGVGNAVFFVLLGQMVSASTIDHFGLFGALLREMTWQRAAGICAMAAGLVLIQRG